MKYQILVILILYAILNQSCVQKTHLKEITFKVDMSALDHPKHVGVRGGFSDNPWTETFKLTDLDNDKIYEGTVSYYTASNQLEFKFVNAESDYELRGSDNRRIDFKYQPEKIIYKAIFNEPENAELIND